MSLNISKDKWGNPVAYDSDIPDLGTTRHQKEGGHFRLRQNNPLPHDFDADVSCRATGKNKAQAADFLRRLCADPVRSASLALLVNRPAGVSKERFQIAARAAGREPMLTANPESVRLGLNRLESNPRVSKGQLYKRVILKPRTLANAKLGHPGGFWGERMWSVFRLKYSNKFVVVTDTGDETKLFNSYGEIRSALTKSGWEIVR